MEFNAGIGILLYTGQVGPAKDVGVCQFLIHKMISDG